MTTAEAKPFLSPVRSQSSYLRFLSLVYILKSSSHCSSIPILRSSICPQPNFKPFAISASSSTSASITIFHGPCFVHLTLVPSKPDDYSKLGTLALISIPSFLYPIPFVPPDSLSFPYPITITPANFGCSSFRKQAPVALSAVGAHAVVAKSYARIFFRNFVAIGEIYSLEMEIVGLYHECTTSDVVTVNLAGSWLINHTPGKEYKLKPIGDAEYERKIGVIASSPST
ncbi:3-isopropylmalate dehydratase protein [Dioscorea alata]|uniref:3-isopropylmalate dehydratase protein n=1 Tax=Dioscorea alata TaxID=55571 RepID=A0ACB7V9N7_DIOAL|nr:3-isopropylmalate dehydratase protein [Dioscorea alata]